LFTDTTGTLLIPWADRFQNLNIFLNKIYVASNAICKHSKTVTVFRQTFVPCNCIIVTKLMQRRLSVDLFTAALNRTTLSLRLRTATQQWRTEGLPHPGAKVTKFAPPPELGGGGTAASCARGPESKCYTMDTTRYDTRRYFNVCSKADMNRQQKKRKTGKLKSKKRLCSDVLVDSPANLWSQSGRRNGRLYTVWSGP